MPAKFIPAPIHWTSSESALAKARAIVALEARGIFPAPEVLALVHAIVCEWHQAPKVSCYLRVGLAATDTPGRLDATVEVSWTSASRSPAVARAAVALYARVADLACLVEAALDELTIGAPPAK